MTSADDLDALDPFPESVVRDGHGILTSLYHGTKAAPFERFRPGGFRRQQLGFGIHFAEDRAFAGNYAKGKRGCILECLVDIRRPVDVTGYVKEGTDAYEFGRALFKGSRQADMWRHLTLGGGTGDLWLNLDLFDARRVLRMLKEQGFDGVRYKAKFGARAYNGHAFGMTVTAESISWIAIDPDQIRVLGVAPAPEPQDPAMDGVPTP